MKNTILFNLLVVFLFFSCNSSDKKLATKISEKQIDSIDIASKGYTLLKSNCYACHSVVTKSHEEIIAPPMVAIIRRYKMSYPEKEDFITAFTNWVLDPKQENALMRGAVDQYNVMPKQPFKKEEVLIIAEYVFDNEIEKPSWFEEHFNEEHQNGMGPGGGKGKGRGRGF